MLTQAEALPLDVQGDGPVEQSVQDGGGHDLVGEDLAPGAPALVGGDDDRFLPLVTLGDDLEEKGGLRTLEGGVSDLVELC